MKAHGTWWIAAAALALALATGACHHGAHADHGDHGEAEKEAETGAPGEDEMAAMMAAGAPGEHHEHLAMLVGDWTYAAKMWMPGAPEPNAMSGTVTAEPMLGGRFVEASWSGEFMGQPFEGVGIDGYDNSKKHYTSTWRDNFGTYTLHYTGHCESDGKVRHTKGVYTDPSTGEEVVDKGKMTFRDDGTVLMESWLVAPDGGETKSMEIVLTRR